MSADFRFSSGETRPVSGVPYPLLRPGIQAEYQITSIGIVHAYELRMAHVHQQMPVDPIISARRPATVAGIDARLSAWGQAARDAVERRAKLVGAGACLYVERVGRNAEVLRPESIDLRLALLSTEIDVLVLVAASLLPDAVRRSCRLLWVDPEKLRANLLSDLAPAREGARAEIRRRQALYRRRARLWRNDPVRLDTLRTEVEGLRVPRSGFAGAERIGRGLLLRHREDAELGYAPPTEPRSGARLSVRPGSVTRWIDQLDQAVASQDPQGANA